MKSYLIIFIGCFLLFNCSEKKDEYQKLILKSKVINSNIYQNFKKNKVETIIFNPTNKAISFNIMSCNYYSNFKLNNNYLKFENIKCDKNIEQIITLQPNEFVKYYFTIINESKSKNQSYKIGFHNNITNIIWSNTLKFN